MAVNLTLFQRLRLWMFKNVPVGKIRKPGWSGAIMHYAFRCPVHGLVVDYPHTHAQVLTCPDCTREDIAKSFKTTLTEQDALRIAGIVHQNYGSAENG